VDNWPPTGTWKSDSGKGNPGQHVISRHAEVWTHVCAHHDGNPAGSPLDTIMIKMFSTKAGIRDVSIYDSPAMPDIGGHSILGGLLTGKGFGAINPNLQVCLTSAAGEKVCTSVCPPSHKCLSQPFRHALPHSSAESVLTIDVYDVDRPGSVHEIVEFKRDPSQCTASRHCKVPVTDTATYGQNGIVEISFSAGGAAASSCDPAQAHVIQFVNSELCNGGTCGAGAKIPSGLTSYPVQGCGGSRNFGQWYLDHGDCVEPFLSPEWFCGDGGKCSPKITDVKNPIPVVVDEPSPMYQDEHGSFQLQKRFVDFVMCGNKVMDVVQWTRSGIGAQACGNPIRTPTSNYQVDKVSSLGTLHDRLCPIVQKGGSFEPDGAQAYGALKAYLDCDP